MTNLRTTGALVALSLLVPLTASAQYINSGPSTSRAVRYSPQGTFNEQPLATNQRDLSVFIGPLANPKFGTNEEAGIHAVHLPFSAFGIDDEGGQMAWFFQLGAAYGITKGFEAGFFIPPLLLAPETGSGDLPIFLTWASSLDDVDVGLRNTITIPLRDTSYFRWNPGIHALVRFASGRLDIGAFFPMIFPDENGGDILATLDVPVRFFFGLNEEMFIGVETGLKKLDIVNGDNDLFMPLGASAIYSIEAGEHRVDLTARFAWQSFVWLNAPEDWPDRVLQDTFLVSFGANMLFDVQSIVGEKDEEKSEERARPTVDESPDVQGRPPTSGGAEQPVAKPPPECVYNDDCDGSQICQNAQCVDPGGQR